MLVAALAMMFDRELRTVRREIEAYRDDAEVWREVPGHPNVGGTLVLHLTGCLRHFLGTHLGGTGYVRDRDAEFARRDVPRSALLAEVEAARAAASAAFGKLGERDLDRDFPEPIAGRRLAVGEFVVHLLAHTAFHLGQLDYHRRAVTGDSRGVGALKQAELRADG